MQGLFFEIQSLSIQVFRSIDLLGKLWKATISALLPPGKPLRRHGFLGRGRGFAESL